MKRILALIVLALVGFYVVWPAWTGYRIASAIQSQDAALLEAKIDFPSVRLGLRPVVEGEVNKELDKQVGQAGGIGAMIGGDIKKQFAPKLVDLVLDKAITGENVIRIAREGGNVGGTMQKIIMEQLSKAGGIPGMPAIPGLSGGSGGGGSGMGALGGILGAAGAAGAGGGLPGGLKIPGFGGGGSPAPEPAAPAPAATTASGSAKPSYGLSNIKSFGLAGPLGYAVSLAKDPAATKPDATIQMGFTGFDWKITGVVPHLN